MQSAIFLHDLCLFRLERERTIIMLRFGLNDPDDMEMTQKEVADYLGISQSYLNVLIALMSPIVPIEIRSSTPTPVLSNFLLNDPDDMEMTQKEVADYLGISQSYISRLEKKIMKRLKKLLPSLHIPLFYLFKKRLLFLVFEYREL